MTQSEHPDFDAEQEYISRAYGHLDRSRESARTVTDNVESRRGGTHQARYERDVIAANVQDRLDDLDIGDQSLIFGRIDRTEGDAYHIGRVAVWDEERNPLVVDWRAPIAEPFYRATGRQTMGLARRRHFITRFRELLGIEDELFTGELDENDDRDGSSIKGERTLVNALETARSGRLGDIVGTIQGEQDEIIRAPLSGAVIVQGGPGTGKTVVALHRAAYLLYTHRFPLARQGVMVIGPNRLFLTYIEQVLPSLGESGVELTVLGDFVTDARVRGNEALHIARIKGDLRMTDVVRRAVRQRQRPLREDLVVPYGVQRLRFTVRQSEELIARTRRRSRFHNHGRKFILEDFYDQLANSGRYEVDPEELRDHLHSTDEVRAALEWMWPVLSATELLHDLYGSKALLRAAGERYFGGSIDSLYRARTEHSEVLWTAQDVPVLDEAHQLVGPRSGKNKDHDLRTYGHIVIDEAQDLSPMQLHMIGRRSLNGSMTIVGDIAQATSAWAHQDWDSVVDQLPTDKGVTRHELTMGYRVPGPLIELAAKVLKLAMPGLTPPRAVRPEGDPPRFVTTNPDDFGTALATTIAEERAAIGAGNIAVICATGAAEDVSEFLNAHEIDHGVAYAGALEKEVSVIEVSMVKGLEIDAAIVIEPDSIVEFEPQGLRSLYVALTRATRRLAIIDTGDSAHVLS
jgi:DNA helicase IV